MRYRGLGRRTRIMTWSLFGLAVLGALAVATPGALDALARLSGPDGQALPWFATRVLAWLAWLAITASVVYGLLLSTGILDAIAQRTVSFTLHQDLAAIGLALGTWHAVILALDRTVPFTLAEVFVPFAAPYRPLWVGLGQVGLYLSLLLIGSFYARKRIGQRTWRRLHYVSFVCFVALTAHGLMAGSDSGSVWAFGAYLAASTLVLFLLTYRVILAIGERLRGAKGAGSSRASAAPVGRPAAVARRAPDSSERAA